MNIEPGVLCIMIPDGREPPLRESFIGRQCVVAELRARDALGMDAVIVVEGIVPPLFTRRTNLLPIGGTPEVEKRDERLAA